MAAVNFPSNPNNNDTFSANGVVYTYNDTKGIWVVSATYNTTQNIIPAANVTYSLGNVTHRWKDLYLSGDTLVLGDVAVKAANGSIAVSNVEANGYVVPAETPVGSGGGTSYGANTDSTTFFALPTGNVAERDSGTANGHIRVNTEFSTLELFYNGGWSNLIYIGKITATGGDSVTTLNGFKIHTFTSSGTFNVVDAPADNSVEVLMVAGGGGGARYGGGGAGGFKVVSGFNVSTQSYPIVIGAGGTAGAVAGDQQGTNGGNTSIFGYTVHGGGGGGSSGATPGVSAGRPGGSGGGGGHTANPSNAGGLGNVPALTPSQGNNGGSGTNSAPVSYSGGGGGGGSAVGQNGSPTVAGNGGDGIVSSITGSSVYYAGGGGAGTYRDGDTRGTGGQGGGGNGASYNASLSVSVAGTAGTESTGGGGGAPYPGGSGIVIIKYRVA